MHEPEIKKELDKAVSRRQLDAEVRALCYRLLKEGTEAQALRGVAVLTYLGEPGVRLPDPVVAGSWPNLPSKEVEVRAIYSLVKDDLSLSRSFVTALLSKPGPSGKVRQQLFSDFVEQQVGDDPILRFVGGVRAVGQRLNQENSAGSVRTRLIAYATKVLKTHRGRIDADGIRSLFGALASLYESSSFHGEQEAAQLVNFLLTQAYGRDAITRINNLREVMSPFVNLGPFLRLGWAAPKLKKVDMLRRVQTADDAVIYACAADTETNLDFTRTLLTIVLPIDTALDQWLSHARARLAQMQSLPKGADRILSLLQAIQETGLVEDVSYANFQDTPPQAAARMSDVVRVLAKEIKRLTHENNYLRSPEAIRKSAGTLIDEELKRQGDVIGKLQQHVIHRRQELADKLTAVLPGLTTGRAGDLEGIISDVIAFLEGRS